MSSALVPVEEENKTENIMTLFDAEANTGSSRLDAIYAQI